jgi:hypothetical protein
MENREEVIKIAVAAIYFNDNSDYLTALWEIVRCLDPVLCELAEDDIREAFNKTHPELKED